MGQAERPTCPNCGAHLILALPPGGNGQRTFQCLECDGPDPLNIGPDGGLAKGRVTSAKVEPSRCNKHKLSVGLWPTVLKARKGVNDSHPDEHARKKPPPVLGRSRLSRVKAASVATNGPLAE